MTRLHFWQIKHDFRNASKWELIDLDDCSQEEVDTFLSVFDRCNNEKQMMTVLNNWGMSDYKKELAFQLMRDPQYYINSLIDELEELTKELQYNLSVKGRHPRQIENTLDEYRLNICKDEIELCPITVKHILENTIRKIRMYL